MFYSQFILAKKGPLGTIWIAAHLERKLKKNQVADTDIGVSVDSILFPEAPIALRLSSHLLLGVVKIYSRKVNYLFSDCSEALLKIKQAFRSTAVDLPPEESTAPYHSITLPETFDLDDFELPDTAFLSGNFVDHHVSTREQITLQDTLDGTGYSTSHFGLDERFGDGDASQIGLDLDEELFMGNNLSFQHVSVPLASEEGLVHQGDVTARHYSMDIDQNQYGHGGDKQDDTSNDLSNVLGNDRGKHVSNIDMDRNDDSHRLVFNIQTPDLNEVFLSDDHIDGPSAVLNAMDTDFAAADPPSPEFIESAHAPSTPRLTDEAFPPNVQEFSAMSPREKPSLSGNFGGNNIDTSITQEFGCPDAMISHSDLAISSHPELPNLAQAVSPTPVTELKHDAVAEWSTKILNAPDAEIDNGSIHKLSIEPDSVNISQVLPSSAFLPTEPIQDSLAPQCSVGVSPDAINGCNVIHPESANFEGANFFQVGPLTLEFAEPLRDSLAPHCCSKDTAAADGTCAESNPKSTGSLPTMLIHNEMSHLPTSDQEYIKGDTNLPETVPLYGLISCNMPTDMVPGLTSDINCNLFKDTTGTSNTGNLGHAEDAVPCHTCNLSTFSPGFHLRSCGSQLNQANVLPLEDTISARNTSEISFREPGSSLELQGEYPLPDNVAETNLGLFQKSTCVLSDRNSGVNPPSLSSNLILKDARLDSFNGVLNARFPEPERMLLAPTGYANLTNDLGQDTAEKGITESDGSVDRINNLRGQKRHLLNYTPVLQNGASPQVSGLSRKRRYNEYIPADDELLASILVGRTPALTMGPTPPLPKTNYLKRPRLTSRVGLSKRRKILLDDTMVLHADAIRQQLINTEDIRRLRKKAPCTRPEIWRIQKSLLEDEIFHETIFTDISADLNSLLSRRYDLDQNVHSPINENNSNILTSNDMELSRSSENFRETGEREMPVHSFAMLDRVGGGMQEHSDTTTLLDAQNCKNATAVDAHLASPLPSDQTQLLRNNQIATVSSAEAYVHESAGTELAFNSPRPENACEFWTDSIVSGKHHDGCFNPDQHLFSGDSLLQTKDTANDAKPASLVVEDMSVDMVDVISSDHPRDDHAKAEEFEALPDSSMHDVQEDRLKDSSTVTAHTQYSPTDVVVGSDAPPDITTTTDYQIETIEGGEVTVGEEPVMEKVLADDERPTSEVVIAERLDAASYQLPFGTETERVPSAVGENYCMQEFNIDGGLVVESSPMDAVARESSDFCSAIDDIDTEFLNVDDGIDHDEEADNDVPNPEEAQSLANSGWSSRTRGVARYLKTMFDEESGRGRKYVAVDHLIAGKTRKEASRMFFETLVLKTRDFIHVEQDNPFGYVTIKPRSKLLKSEF